MSNRLEGKVALITGAASGVKGETMGFGGAAAWLFAAEGAKVAVCDIKDEQGKKTVTQLREAGHEAVFISLDVTSEEQWKRAITETVKAFGKLNVLVNNAGMGYMEKVEFMTVEQWDYEMAVHAKGTFLGTKHAIPEMRKAGGGSIVNTSSIFGFVGSPDSTAYHAGKGAARIFTKAAAIQYAKENIRVNSIHPGGVVTPMTEQMLSKRRVREAFEAKVPMGRLGMPEEIARGMVFLASDEASYITGAELVIDGGFIAQ
ncbi:MAG: glucose 1-dehydrogenase [Chloroflexi bacterium]|nr:glucose 1-dehydrogenase [Chloroflexota bacterium]